MSAQASNEKDWASHPLFIDERTLVDAERGLTVALIATRGPRTCELSDKISAVLSRKDLNDFDHVPVTDKHIIVGLLHKDKILSSAECAVSQEMENLTENNLISSDAGILAFVTTADEVPCRLVVQGEKIGAIVTLSDLQKLPVRPAIFLLITHLELLMAEIIRRRWRDPQDWLKALSEKRRNHVINKWASLQKSNLAIDEITATDFCDKRDIMLGAYSEADKLASEKKELVDVEELRNSVAHSGDYATTRENAIKTAQRARLARDWIGRLREYLDRLEQ